VDSNDGGIHSPSHTLMPPSDKPPLILDSLPFHGTRIQKKSILELGAGGSIPVLTAAVYDVTPNSVTITDLNPERPLRIYGIILS